MYCRSNLPRHLPPDHAGGNSGGRSESANPVSPSTLTAKSNWGKGKTFPGHEGRSGEGQPGLSGIIDQKLPPERGGRSLQPDPPTKRPQTLVWGAGEGRGKDPEITHEATKLLDWIESRGRVTRSQVLMLGPPEYRRLRRLCVDELIAGGYIKRVDGWYLPANKPSREGR